MVLSVHGAIPTPTSVPAQLNTASYINIVAEPEEQSVALAGLAVNIADQTVYPGSMQW
jgi:hypothetical protein